MQTAVGRLLPAVLMTFAAGLLLGYITGQRSVAAPSPGLSPSLSAYEKAFIDALRLDQEQQKDLHLVLLGYEREMSRILDLQRLELEPQLTSLDQRFRELIRSRILRPDQRKLAKGLMEAQPVPDPEITHAALSGRGTGG